MPRLLSLACLSLPLLLAAACGDDPSTAPRGDAAAEAGASAVPSLVDGAATGGPTADASGLLTVTGAGAFADTVIQSVSAPRVLTVQNGTAAAATALRLERTGDSADFDVTNGCAAELAPGASCALSVVFAPKTAGAKRLELRVISAVGETSTAVTGKGVPPSDPVVSPTSLSFTATIGSETTKTVLFTNTGNAPAPAPTARIDGSSAAHFAVPSVGCRNDVAPGQSCEIEVVFKPTSTGPKSASLEITVGNTRMSVALAGTALPLEPDFSVAPSGRAFPDTLVGARSAPQVFTAKNVGGRQVGPPTVVVADPTDFAVDSTCNTPIAPGGACSITVVFAPKSPGNKQTSVTVSTGLVGGPTLTVAGTALSP